MQATTSSLTPEQHAHLEKLSSDVNTRIMDVVMSYDSRVVASSLLNFSGVLLGNLISGGLMTEEQARLLIEETFTDIGVKRKIQMVTIDPSEKKVAS